MQIFLWFSLLILGLTSKKVRISADCKPFLYVMKQSYCLLPVTNGGFL